MTVPIGKLNINYETTKQFTPTNIFDLFFFLFVYVLLVGLNSMCQHTVCHWQNQPRLTKYGQRRVLGFCGLRRAQMFDRGRCLAQTLG